MFRSTGILLFMAISHHFGKILTVIIYDLADNLIEKTEFSQYIKRFQRYRDEFFAKKNLKITKIKTYGMIRVS